MEAAVQGILNVFSPVFFFWIFLGVIIGTIVGILPGIGGVAAIAILLPVTYGKNPCLYEVSGSCQAGFQCRDASSNHP